MKSSYFFILIIIISVITLTATVLFAKDSNKKQMQDHYFKQDTQPFGVEVSQILLNYSVVGKVKETGQFWQVEANGQTYSVINLPDVRIIRGSSFSPDDSINWQSTKSSEIKSGDQIQLTAYYHPEKKYLVPTFIFLFNK